MDGGNCMVSQGTAVLGDEPVKAFSAALLPPLWLPFHVVLDSIIYLPRVLKPDGIRR